MSARSIAALIVALAVTNPAAAEITNAPAAPPTEIEVTTVAKGLEHPWGLAFLPDGRPIVTERPGRVRIVGADGTLSPPLAGVPPVYAEGQGGLLDIALAPDFASSNRLYLSFAERREGGKSATAVARAKLALVGDGGRLEGLEIIFRQEPAVASGFHFGSRLVFARDGSLFITTGDRGSMRAAVQDPKLPIGKVIHVGSDGKAIGAPRAPGWDPRVHSMGHRNIQGAAIDLATGQLWTVEHGARGGDELNQPEAGKNYGWPIITYGRDYSGAQIGEGTSKAGLEQPVYYWDPSIATSGLAIYTGSLFPGWKGNLLVGGLAGARLVRLVVENGTVVAEEKLLVERGDRIRDVRQGPDGAVYVLTDEARGELLRISPRNP
ncbi:MAG: PQQ-dependent sugar dehydrogenase [Pseudomonadota bacterium]